MFSRFYRYFIIVVSLLATVFFFMKEDYLNMSMMLGAAALLFFGHYRYGTVYEAFQQLKKENYAKAEKLPKDKKAIFISLKVLLLHRKTILIWVFQNYPKP